MSKGGRPAFRTCTNSLTAIPAGWRTEGLPADPLSTENAAIIVKAARFPLIIDPQLQAIVWPEHQQGVAYLQAHFRQVVPDWTSFAPDAGELDTVAFAKIKFTDCLSGKAGSGVECGIHEGQALGFERAEIRRHFRFDLEFL